MRIRCSFILEPQRHTHHEFAVGHLRSWREREKLRQDATEVQQQRSSDYHRDIYLTGLYMEKLSPQLPGLIAQSFNGDSITLTRLQQLLQQVGVSDADESGLSEAQWQKLTSMLKIAMAAPKSEANVDLGGIEQQLKQLSLPDASPQLEQILATQQQLLERLSAQPQPAATGYPSELERDLATLRQGQEKLLAQLKNLKVQVATASPTAAPAEPEESMDTQMEKARRIKAKGLW